MSLTRPDRPQRGVRDILILLLGCRRCAEPILVHGDDAASDGPEYGFRRIPEQKPRQARAPRRPHDDDIGVYPVREADDLLLWQAARQMNLVIERRDRKVGQQLVDVAPMLRFVTPEYRLSGLVRDFIRQQFRIRAFR